MKFYYNGNLVRTSKNHVYTHAIFNMKTGKVVSCSSSYELAIREMQRRINFYDDKSSARAYIEQNWKIVELTQDQPA